MGGDNSEHGSDEPLYLTYAQPELHPGRLGAVAALSGFSAALPEACSFVELGCGDGGNVIPLAESFPASTFLGVDLDSRAIAVAQARASKLGLTNVTFQHIDLLNFTIAEKSADYIVCHGVYSWVPPTVQEKVLEVISIGLKAHGVGYVSYNVLPGWRTRGVLRDIMKFGVSLGRVSLGKATTERLSPEERLKYGAQFLTFVSGLRQDPEDTYGTYLKDAIARLQHADLPYLVNEYLGEYNEPCTFIEFAEKAAARGLSYLGEARPALLFSEDVGDRVEALIAKSKAGLLYREQALDYCRNRMFRETLLCRTDSGIACDVSSVRTLPEVFCTTEYTPILPVTHALSGGEVSFSNAITGREISVSGGDEGVLLSILGESATGGLGASELAAEVTTRGLPSMQETRIREVLLALLKRGAIDIWLSKLPVSGKHDLPVKISSFARMQAESAQQEDGGSVSSAGHRTLPLSAQECAVLLACNGQRTVEALKKDGVLLSQCGTDEELSNLVDSLSRRGFFASAYS